MSMRRVSSVTRPGTRLGPYLPGAVDSLGYLAVVCWCGRKTVHARPEEIRAGQTGSCGRPNCKPPRRNA